MNTDSQWSKQEACFAHATQVWLTVNYNTVSHQANEFDVGSEVQLHGQVSLALSIKFCVVHEALNG